MAIYSLKRLSQVFKALANHRRMMIIKLLAKNNLSVIEIAKRLDMTIPVCSFHLLKMEREGILIKEKKGKYIYYSPASSFRNSGIYKQIVQSF